MMAPNERDFKGVWIPKEVWLDDRLNALDKVILTEIDSLDSSERGCWASNQFIAEFCQCSESKVSKAISKLIELDYLYLQSFDGRTRELKSRLSNYERQSSKKCEAGCDNLPQSNTVSNPDSNPSNNKGTRSRFVPPTVDEVRAYCIERKNGINAEQFIDYYTARGWMIGKNKMKDWKASVRTWERNGFNTNTNTGAENTNSADRNDDLDNYF